MGFERQVEGSHCWEETPSGAIVDGCDDDDADDENEKEEKEEDTGIEAKACLVLATLQNCVSQLLVCVARHQ